MKLIDAKKWFVFSVLGVMLVQGALPTSALAGECDQAENKIVELERQIGELRKEIEKLKGKKPGKPGAVTRTTLPSLKYPNGVTFTKVARKGFGEAWQDPSGLIWGNIVKTNKGNIWKADQFEATKYCESIGARLPSREDFVRLREYLGATKDGSSYSAGAYAPQVLPSLDENWFWSSSVHPNYSELAYNFLGRYGDINYANRAHSLPNAVRCVAPSPCGK